MKCLRHSSTQSDSTEHIWWACDSVIETCRNHAMAFLLCVGVFSRTTTQLPIRVGRVIINDDDHVNAPNSHSVATSGSNLVE